MNIYYLRKDNDEIAIASPNIVELMHFQAEMQLDDYRFTTMTSISDETYSKLLDIDEFYAAYPRLLTNIEYNIIENHLNKKTFNNKIERKEIDHSIDDSKKKKEVYDWDKRMIVEHMKSKMRG